jgi:membrane-associated HD superfamily phosphohydrolase
MTNPRQKKQLLIMLIILAIIAVGFFAITAYNKYQSNKEAEDQIHISTIENINKISYNNGTDSLSFALDEDENWYYTENPDFPLQSSYVESLEETIKNLTAIREIPAEESDDLSAYGLENPEATITIEGSGGQTENLLLGNSNSNGYYLKLSSSDTIYTIDSQLKENISMSLYDMAEIEDIPAFDVGKLESITINDTVITVKTTEVTDNSESTDESTEDNTENTTTETIWYNGETDVSEYSQISSLSYNIPYLMFSGLAAWQPTEDEIQQMGFDNPITVVFKYQEDDGTENSYTLLIGNTYDDTNYYAMVPNSDRVYYISNTEVQAIVSIAEDGLDANISLTDDTDETSDLDDYID